MAADLWPPNSQPPSSLGGLAVLLLANDGAACLPLRQQFTAALPTCRLIEANGVAQALDLWRREAVNCVLLDGVWAAGGGLDFLAALGQAYPQRPLPVVVLVDPGQERATLEAMKLGAADFIYRADLTPGALRSRLEALSVYPSQTTSPGQGRPLYQTLVEQSPDIIERFDCDLRHLYVSPVMAQITGIETHRFIGKTCRELGFDETMVNAWETAAAAAIATGENQVIEFTTPTLAGLRHFEMAIALERSEAGELTSLLCVSRDITDRVVAQQAQRQKHEAHLQAAQRIGNLGSWEFDLATEQILWSDQVYRIFGLAVGEPPPSFEGLQSLYHPDDRDRHRLAVETTLATHQPYDEEFRIVRRDGRLVYIQVKGEALLDGGGQPSRLTGTVQDISQRKLAEAELESLSLRLSLAMEAGKIGSWERDLITDVVNSDQRLLNLYGLDAQDQITTYQAWRSLVYPDDVEPTEAALQATLRHGIPYDVEFRIRRADGQLRWIKSNALVSRTPQGQPTRIIGVNYDITKQKEAEAQLLNTTAQLETSNRELEAFAYSVSHDLRAPLRAIDGFSRALVEDYGDQFGEEGRDYFERIRHNVGRMGDLIDHLLRLSRVSRQAMTRSPVNLSALVQEQLDDLSAADPDRRVTVTIAPDCIVSADPTLIQMAIANLVQNAWKFTRHQVAAAIEFGVIDDASGPIYCLRDNGAGFDMAHADKLFGVFQRLHNPSEFPGTGIGLATVQRAIYRHQGQVWARSAVDQGATFYFTVPPPPTETRQLS